MPDLRDKPKRPGPDEVAKSFLDTQGVAIWGGGVTADFNNIVAALSMSASDPSTWTLIRRKKTIEQYVEAQYPRPKDKKIRDLILPGINQEFLTKANAIVSEINTTIGDGVKTQAQADALMALEKKFSDLVYRRIG